MEKYIKPNEYNSWHYNINILQFDGEEMLCTYWKIIEIEYYLINIRYRIYTNNHGFNWYSYWEYIVNHNISRKEVRLNGQRRKW